MSDVTFNLQLSVVSCLEIYFALHVFLRWNISAHTSFIGKLDEFHPLR